jgi:hypothetical protein
MINPHNDTTTNQPGSTGHYSLLDSFLAPRINNRQHPEGHTIDAHPAEGDEAIHQQPVV